MNEHDDMPRDPAISHRYREAGAGRDMAPPPALDARILAAAREAVRPAVPPRPRPWWRKLALPVGVAATTMLAVMLSLTVQRHAPQNVEREESAPAAPARAKPVPETSPPAPANTASDVSRQPAPPAASAGRSDNSPPPAAPRAERLHGAAPAALAVEKKAAPAAAAAALASKPAAPAPAPASADAVAAPPGIRQVLPSATASGEASSEAPRLKGEAAGKRAAEHAPEAESRARLQKALPAVAAPAPLGSSARETPGGEQAWIDEIRELRRQGRDEEAARRLAEFRRAYPEYVLPEDLR